MPVEFLQFSKSHDHILTTEFTMQATLEELLDVVSKVLSSRLGTTTF